MAKAKDRPILNSVIIDETDSRLDDELMHLRGVLRERWRMIEPLPPELLYHYTDLQGFSGIVGTGSIWATLSSSLNDEKELLHASAQLRRVLRAKAEKAHLMLRHMLLPPEALEFEYARQDAMEVFVASLSSHPDHARQWCMYAREGQGVALGFRSADLRSFEPLESRVPYFAIGKVIYDDVTQLQFLSWVVHYWFERMAKLFPGLALRSSNLSELTYLRASILGTLAGATAGYLPLMKSDDWSLESEWRLGHAQDPKKPHGLVRYRGSARIPYVPLDVRSENGLLSLAEVVVGPGFAREESVVAVGRFLHIAGYENVQIKLSGTPSASPQIVKF